MITIGLLALAAGGYGLKTGLFSPQPLIQTDQNLRDNNVKIVTSFYPLADFSKNVGGNLVTVTNITPAGAEPHDYEPTPQDIVKAYDAQLFVFNGNGVDTWAEKIQNDLEKKGVTALKMSDHINSLKNDADNKENPGYDPHFWLNPANAAKEAEVIAAALTTIDPAHAAEYQQNSDDYQAKLAGLDQAYQNGLADCSYNEIVTSHNAFNYLANRYGLRTFHILGLSPDEEPSPQVIAAVADIARQKNIKYIFFESLVSPKLSQTIANEIGAQTMELNPIEGLTDAEIAQGEDYIGKMEANLTNLRIALQCR